MCEILKEASLTLQFCMSSTVANSEQELLMDSKIDGPKLANPSGGQKAKLLFLSIMLYNIVIAV